MPSAPGFIRQITHAHVTTIICMLHPKIFLCVYRNEAVMLINLSIILFAIPISLPIILPIILKFIPDLMLMALQKLIIIYYQLSGFLL